RLNSALEHLATSDHKLRERVLDAYEEYLSVLIAKEFPDQETRKMFEEIEAQIKSIEDRIDRKPGAYESLLRNKIQTPIQIAKQTLDYRAARRLAKLIVNLYFKVETEVLDQYERELDSLAQKAR
ncbi:hypothetical protein, partial [Candidatus Binatus sp.]